MARRSGVEGVKPTKEFFEYPPEPAFFVPDAALTHFRNASSGASSWNRRLERQVRYLREKVFRAR